MDKKKLAEVSSGMKKESESDKNLINV